MEYCYRHYYQTCVYINVLHFGYNDLHFIDDFNLNYDDDNFLRLFGDRYGKKGNSSEYELLGI